MKTATLLASTLFCLALAYPSRADTDAMDITRQVDEVFAEWDSTTSPGCALSVIHDGEVIYSRGYGMANLEHGLAITPSSVFRIGSTSKQFAAAAIALLAEQGKLSLDDDVRKHVPELPAYDPPVTVRHLVHHTSGLRDYLVLMRLAGKRNADFYTNEEVLEILSRQKALNFTPGAEHLYSNTGYFLMSVIVERASGKTLREYADEHIFRPLGMRSSHFHDNHRHIVKKRANGYSRTPDGFEISQTALEMVGDGGVYTSVEDLYLWDQNFYDNRLGSGGPALIDQLLTPGVLNDGEKLTYAFGLGVNDYRGLAKVAHGGAFVGYRAEMIRFPDEKLSVICLCNLAQTNPSQLAQAVADLYLADKLAPLPASAGGDAGTEVARAEVSAEALAPLAGHYYDRHAYLLRRIEPREGKLFYVRGPGSESELAPLGDGRFLMLGVPVTVEVAFKTPEGSSQHDMYVTVSDGEPSHYERVDAVNYTADDMAQFAGAFYSEELEATYQVVAGDEGLVVTGAGGREIELVPAVPDTFTGPVTLEFSREAQGAVRAFTVAAGRVRGIEFVRVRP